MMDPALAHTYNPKKDNGSFPKLVQYKLDGVRMLWDGVSELVSRTGKPILGLPGVANELSQFFFGEILDGEAYSQTLTFEEISGQVRSHSGDNEAIKFVVFDKQLPVSNYTRQAYLNLCKCLTLQRIEFLDAQYVANPLEIEPLLYKALELGSEGLILRDPRAPYVGGRTRNLLKVKTTRLVDVRIHSCFQGQGRLSNTLGSIICILDEGIGVSVGGGFTDEQRDQLWEQRDTLPDRVITIKFQELTRYGVPRFPIFVGFRDEP